MAKCTHITYLMHKAAGDSAFAKLVETAKGAL